MPVKTSGGLETISLVLTAHQTRALRQLRDDRQREFSRISVSDVAREVVAAGLASVLDADDTDMHTIGTSLDDPAESEAA